MASPNSIILQCGIDEAYRVVSECGVGVWVRVSEQCCIVRDARRYSKFRCFVLWRRAIKMDGNSCAVERATSPDQNTQQQYSTGGLHAWSLKRSLRPNVGSQ